MYLSDCTVQNFRNIKNLRFVPGQRVNVIFGRNGQGKTNLLESIYLLTGAKSFRTRKDAELIEIGEEKSVVDSRFFLDGRTQSIRLFVSSCGRTAEYNNGGEKKASSLAGVFCSVLFSPEHLMLIKGNAQQRRKFIDLALCQISPRYLSELKKYSRLLRQKNGLLKYAFNTAGAYEMLDVYDELIASSAKTVTERRIDFCKKLLLFASEEYSAITGEKERLGLSYRSTVWEGEEISLEEGLYSLSQRRDADVRAGFSTTGPHRDDILISIDDKDARSFASQGQQRSAVLSFKLAETAVMEQVLGESPLLLLDDVLSELDKNRQDFLLGRLAGRQTIITGCDPSLISGRIKASVFEMKNGELVV